MSTPILSAGIIGASGFDPDAINFLNVAAITNTTQRYALNTAVRDLKNANIWGKLRAVYPVMGTTATSQKWNLKNPVDSNGAHRIIFNGGISHSSSGFIGNGTNAYADTNFNVTDLSAGDAHLAIYNQTNTTPTSVEIDMGSFNESTFQGALLASEITAGTVRARLFNNAADFVAAGNTGFFLITTTSDTRLFTKGVKRTTIANSGTFPLTSGNIFVGALNSSGTPTAAYYTPQTYSWVSIGDGLSDTQATDYYNIVQAYQTTLGRSA